MWNKKVGSASILTLQQFPVLNENALLKEALTEMTRHGIGFAGIINKEGELISVFTDGDFRRLILKYQQTLPALLVSDLKIFSKKNFLWLNLDDTFEKLKDLAKNQKILCIPVLDGKKLVGLINIQSVMELFS
jgi:CBS domain-containing protein